MKKRQTVNQQAQMLQTSVQFRTACMRAVGWSVAVLLLAALVVGLLALIVPPTNAAAARLGGIEYTVAAESNRPTRAQHTRYLAALRYAYAHPELSTSMMSGVKLATPAPVLFVRCAISAHCVVLPVWLFWWSALPVTAQWRQWLEWAAGALLLALLPWGVSLGDVRGWREWERRQVEEQGQARLLAARRGIV